MPFDPLYAAGPGRPQSFQRFLDPSLVGQQLQALPVAEPEPIKAPGVPYQPTTQDRVTGAVASFGANTDPRTPYGPEAFLGSAARGFAGVKNYLAALTQQHAEGQRQAQQDDLNRRNIESQIADRSRLRESPAVRPADLERMTGEDGLMWNRNRQTGVVTPIVGPDGTQLRAPKPAERPTEPPKQPSSAIALSRAFADRAEEAEPLLLSTPVPSNLEFEAGMRSPFEAGKSQAFRRWYANALRFITPILRKESGSTIQDSEVRQAMATYIPLPGDTPETLRTKAEARRSTIRAMRTMGNQSDDSSGVAPPADDNPYRRP